VSSALITTIIPTFRRPDLLRRAVESVQAQAFENVKIVICDNDSGDQTEHVVAEMCAADNRITYIKRSNNIGPGPNMVQAVSEVETPFFSLLNDDDFLLPGFYQDALNALSKQSNIGFVCAKTLSVDADSGSMFPRNSDWQAGVYPPSNSSSSKMFASHFVQSGVLMKTCLTKIIGPFDLLGNDVLFMTLAASAESFAVLDSYGAVFTYHSKSYSVAQGLSSEPDAKLHEAMLSTMGFVVRSALPDDRKFNLILLVVHYYNLILDSQTLRALAQSDREYASTPWRAPSNRCTLLSAILAIKSGCPSFFEPIFQTALAALLSNRKRRLRRGGLWIKLPQAAREYLVNCECDTEKFNALVGANGFRN
jgi:glycosyltransferase involved in cell wall biosynthesis